MAKLPCKSKKSTRYYNKIRQLSQLLAYDFGIIKVGGVVCFFLSVGFLNHPHSLSNQPLFVNAAEPPMQQGSHKGCFCFPPHPLQSRFLLRSHQSAFDFLWLHSICTTVQTPALKLTNKNEGQTPSSTLRSEKLIQGAGECLEKKEEKKKTMPGSLWQLCSRCQMFTGTDRDS